MDDRIYIEQLGRKLFSETHQIWTEEEIDKEWKANNLTREHYIWLAEISWRFFQSIYYSL